MIQTVPHDSPEILVFCDQKFWQNSNRSPLQGRQMKMCMLKLAILICDDFEWHTTTKITQF